MKALAVALLLAACVPPPPTAAQSARFSFVYHGQPGGFGSSNVWVITDTQTGREYLWIVGPYKAGLCPLSEAR